MIKMRSVMDIIKEDVKKKKRLFHGSRHALEVGVKLAAKGTNLLDDDIEDALEISRPPNKISRRSAVYMAASREALDLLALGTKHIYVVEPTETVSRHDHEWVNRLFSVFATSDDGRAVNPKLVAALAQGYWSGREYWSVARKPRVVHPPQIEYLAVGATVIGEAS
jgi:hypothetical protein